MKKLAARISFLTCIAICTANALSGQLPDVKFAYVEGLPPQGAPRDIIQSSDGMIWMAYVRANAGLIVYDGVSVRHIQTRADDENGLPDLHINGLCEGPGGNIWIATHSYSLCIYYTEEDRFERVDLSEMFGVDLDYVHDFSYTQDGYMWISCVGGLVQYDPLKDKFQLHTFRNTGLDSLGESGLNRMRFLVEDSWNPNHLWIGTLNGLISFDKSTAAFTRHVMPFSAAGDFGGNNDQYLVMHITFLDRNTLALGTWSGGLITYEIESNAWKQYRDPEVPFIDDVVYQTRVRNENELWIASTHGFGLLYRDTGKYLFYDSIPSAAMANQIGRYVSAFRFNELNGALVLGAIGGAYLQFDSIGQLPRTLSPPVVRSVYVEDRLIPPFNNTYPERIVTLASNQSSAAFGIVSPGFPLPEPVVYRYRTTGTKSPWQSFNPPESIRIEDVSGGTTQLQFQASLDGKTWLEGASWVVKKDRTFWQARELKLIVIGVVIVGFMLYWALWNVQKRKRAELEKSFRHLLAESEMSALRAQMNPHFIFNSLNSIKTYVLKQDTAVANKYLTRFAHLMRLVLRNSKSRLITLADELHALDLYLEIEKLRFDDGFDSVVKVDEAIDPEAYYIPPMLVQPYVENAIWHGLMHKKERGLLSITISNHEKTLNITIQDNGIGRERSAELQRSQSDIQKSYGSQITRDRIALIRQSLNIEARVHIEDLYDDRGRATGTRVHLTLPHIGPKAATRIIN